MEEFSLAVRGLFGGKLCDLDFILKMATGVFDECPFNQGQLDALRARIMKLCCIAPGDDEVAEGQVFHLSVLSTLLKTLGDPD